MSLRVPWASPEVVDQVLRLGRDEDPLEACGVVLPDSTVVQLPNRSPNPGSSYVIDSEDLVNAIEAWVEKAQANPDELTREHFIVWHTHPGGVVGPGPGDMREKLEGFQYLVVSLPNGEAVKF